MTTASLDGPERHRWLREAFEAVLEHEPPERAAAIDRLCDDDPAGRRDLEALLRAHGSGTSLSDRPAARAVRELLLEPEPSTVADRRIGPYRLVERIAVGGMGAVYRAERRDGGFDQTVAIKILPLGRDTDELLRRFAEERRILAGLAHPNIARLFDGGTTEDGLPYIVMEYVEGRSIDAYCDEERLSVDERLSLFLEVCEAVQAAHRALVVHRDLKPSNILVGDDGTPRLLDFGIAKALDPDLAAVGRLATASTLRPMTPAYASPEQARGEPVTTATDVFSLGVILYELLAGRRPFAKAGAGDDPEPDRPSAAVDAEAARRAGTTPERLRRRLRGDLDTVVLKALRREPDRRYATVVELAADLRRHRSGHPVAARPDTFGYRARKFVRRNRAGVAAAAAVVAALVGGIAATTHQARQAEAERVKSEAMVEFLEDVLSMASPGWLTSGDRAGPDVTVAEAVDRAAAEAADRLGHIPDAEARIRRSLAMTYFYLGRYDDAREQAARALEQDRRAFPDERSLAIGRDLALLADADHLLGRFDAAESGYREAIEILDATLEEPDTLQIATVNNLGLLLWWRGRPAEGEPYLRRALEMNRSAYGSVHPVVAITLNNLGRVCEARGDLACAERRIRQSLDVWARLEGRERMEHGVVLTNLGRILSLRGSPEAEAPLVEGVELLERTVGGAHEHYAMGLVKLADHHVQTGEVDRAGAEIRRATDVLNDLLEEGHPHLALAGLVHARVLLAEGRAADAEAVARASMETMEEAYDPADPRSAEARLVLGATLVGQGRAAEAAPILERARSDLVARLGSDHPLAAEADRALASASGR